MIEISIVVSTKNESANLPRLLASIDCQTVSPTEVIVVDNSSSDDTVILAKNFGAIVFDRGPERSAQRNYGISMASGEYVMYLDADMVLHPSLIEEISRLFESKSNIGGLYIPEYIVGKGLFGRLRRFERKYYTSTAVDAVRVIKKNIFHSVGGFDESLTGPEDWDFSMRLSDSFEVSTLVAKFNPESNWPEKLEAIGVFPDLFSGSRVGLLHWEKSLAFQDYLLKKGKYSKDMSKYKAKWGGDHRVVTQLSPFRRIGLFFSQNNGALKRTFTGINLLLVLAVLALRGISLMINKVR